MEDTNYTMGQKNKKKDILALTSHMIVIKRATKNMYIY